jgi:general secretion pathway protein G
MAEPVSSNLVQRAGVSITDKIKMASYNQIQGETMTRQMRKRIDGSRGFTLIELMVVIVILGILAGLIVPRIMGRPEEAKQLKAALQIESLETALKLYKLDSGSYPDTEQGLEALVEMPETGNIPTKWREGGYLEKGRVPKDPWENAFVYLSPGIHGDYDIISYGADGVPGGEDKNKDINNWEIE